MNYLNTLTIRIYTLMSVLFTHLPNWFQHGMTLVTFPFNQSWDNINHTTVNQLYNNGNSSVVDFYVNFDKYLTSTRPIFTWTTSIVGHFASWLYDLANVIVKAYVSLFSVFSDFTENKDVNTILRYAKYAGWVAFFALLVVYGFGMIFNIKGGFSRVKDLIVGTLMAIFMLAILPTLTNGFVGGMQKAAVGMLGVSSQSSVHNTLLDGDSGNYNTLSTPEDELIKDNVVSIPNMTTYAALHNESGIDLDAHNKIFQPTGNQFSNNVPAKNYNINLYHMADNNSQGWFENKNIWNGLGNGDVSQFLSHAGGDGYYLNKKTMDRNGQYLDKNANNPGFYGLENGLRSSASAAFGGLLGEHVFQKLANWWNQGKNVEDGESALNYKIFTPYTYQIQGNGDNAQLSLLSQFDQDNSGAFTAFDSNYANYHVNWFNIICGLIALNLVLFGLIFKLSNSFFKMVVMYATSGWFLFKNAAHHDKIKDFVKTFLGIFENLMIDLVVLRLFVTVYLSLTATLQRMPISPLAIGFLQPLLAYGLFQVESKGIDTLSSQMSGSKTSSGHGLAGIATAALGYGALRSAAGHAGRAGKGAARGAGSGITSAARMGRGAASGWQNQKAKMTGQSPSHPIQDAKKNMHATAGNATTTEYPGSPGSSGSGNSNTSQRGKGSNGNSGNDKQNMKSSPQGKGNSSNNGFGKPNGNSNDSGNDTFDNGNPAFTKSTPNSKSERFGRAAGFLGRRMITAATAPLQRVGRRGDSTNQGNNMSNANNMNNANNMMKRHKKLPGGNGKGIPSGNEGPNNHTDDDNGPISMGGPNPDDNPKDDGDDSVQFRPNETSSPSSNDNYQSGNNRYYRHNGYNHRNHRYRNNKNHRSYHRNHSNGRHYNRNYSRNLNRRRGHNGRGNNGY